MSDTITIVGGGLAGLVAAIEAAEAGVPAQVLEAHPFAGGRARSTTGEFKANLGPHAIYADGPMWAWLDERGLVADSAKALLHGFRFRHDGHLRRVPPRALLSVVRLMRHPAPVDVDWRTWVTEQVGARAAEITSAAAGVFSFDPDPGRLSAAFVRERFARVLAFPPGARFVRGGWSTLVDRLVAHATALGVRIDFDARVGALPDPPVIVATELAAARRLLGDESLQADGGRAVLLDVGMTARRGDPYVVVDLDEAGWVERFSAQDPTVAPAGHSLVQAQLGARSGESLDDGVARLEHLLDLGIPRWREREVWRRRSLVDGRSGALDLPGHTWRDRPAIERGDGVFLCGDMVAAPGLLAEVAFTSARHAAHAAVVQLDRARARAVAGR